MPIFQDDIGGGRPTPPAETGDEYHTPPTAEIMRRKESEESIRTELCEGPILDGQNDPEASPLMALETQGPRETMLGISDRVELIERLKRGESPTWMPNRHLESILHGYDSRTLARRPITNTSRSPPLLPSVEIKESSRKSSAAENDALQAGLSIERPRSALHSGDFTQDEPKHSEPFGKRNDVESNQGLYKIPMPSWLSTSPPRNFSSFRQNSDFPTITRPSIEPETPSRPPSLSSSLSSSFIFKPPTSPLVQSESNDDVERSTLMDPIDITTDPQRNHRRHTYQNGGPGHSSPSAILFPPSAGALPYLRRDNANAYQAHQPRRSISLAQTVLHPELPPQMPAFLRSRRPSFNSDSSPLQIASMVGSYEESILRGRMSTSPSRPLDFVAQIGVLGLGKCKSSLRCPAHVTLPFPAVFYSYGTTTHGRSGKSEDSPSPYVGQIDLENGLANPDDTLHDSRRRRPRVTPDRKVAGDYDIFDPSTIPTLSEKDVRRAQKQKRRSTSPKAPPGGSYRIPEKGQLQIIIKNPNKTAVKLFLVPYDLAGMEPGTKTFIRQRSYSAGPIIDTPLSSSPQPQPQEESKDRLTLRYLVHLHICCPSRGRFYLYKTIRVVFANRVPDGKEKLRNEIQLPEPRFSVYKPGRESNHVFSSGPALGASLANEKAFRRRSSGFALGPSHRAYDAMDGIALSLQGSMANNVPYPHTSDFRTTPVEPIPFALFQKRTVPKDEEVQIQSPTSSKDSRPSISQDSGVSASWTSSSTGIGGYDKLNKGDIGYGGNAFSGLHNGQQSASESLLAKKLKCLGVGKADQDSPAGSI